jgi:hypothetical protein
MANDNGGRDQLAADLEQSCNDPAGAYGGLISASVRCRAISFERNFIVNVRAAQVFCQNALSRF